MVTLSLILAWLIVAAFVVATVWPREIAEPAAASKERIVTREQSGSA